MGDSSHSELYTSLLAFLEQYGLLALEGVAERGMPGNRALEFIALLESHRVPIYGLEVWRNQPTGYSIDLPWIWASRAGNDHDYANARAWLSQAALQSQDLVAVQFG